MKEFGEKVLCDGFRVCGTSYEKFKKETAELTEITKGLIVKNKDVTFLSLCEIPEYQVAGKVSFFILSQSYLLDFMENGKKIHVGTINEEKIGSSLLDELRSTTGLIAIIHNEKYIISDIAVPTLSIRASVSGDLTINRQNLIRNMHFADAIFSKNDSIHFVYREIQIGEEADGTPIIAKKIFAALGKYFKAVPQTILSDITDIVADEKIFGKTDIREWSIDHRFTDLYIEFPDAGEDFKDLYKLEDLVIPGIFLCTSDAGNSSIIARGVYRKGSSYVITDEVMVKHTSKATVELIKEKMDEIFINIRKLPETLAQLIGEEVIDYSKTDLSTERGGLQNYEAVKQYIEKTAKKSLKGILPAKHLDVLVKCMCDEINSSVPYTLYDIATLFMEVPERVEGIDMYTLTEVRKACAKVPYILQHKTVKTEEKDIFLLPS